MSSSLTEILASWPGRWRYPALVTTLSSGKPVADDDAAQAILAGIADSMTATGAVKALIADGEFGLVETLFTEQGESGYTAPEFSAESLRALRRELADARRTARADVEREQAALAERARRVGLVPASLTDLAEHAALRRADAQATIDAECARIVEAEQRTTVELAELLRGIEGETRRAAVQACIDAGEFPTARRLLDSGGHGVWGNGPSSVPRPPLWESAMGLTLEEILLRYPPNPPQAHHPQLTGFVDVGAAGLEVVEALRHLSVNMDAPNAGAFAGALARVLGEDVQPPVEAHDGGLRTVLVGLDDARLPGLLVTRRTGLTLWIADADTPPPEELSPPIVWFVPTAEPVHRPRPQGTAVLNATDLLCLLARPFRDASVGPTGRRINLLRAIVPQLIEPPLLLAGVGDPDMGIELSSVTSPRDALAWLLDLCGVAADAVVIDALEYETGAHPIAAWEMLTRLLPLLSAPDRRLTRVELDAIRNRETRSLVRQRMIGALDAEERAVLGTVYALQLESRFGAAEVLADLRLVGLPDELTDQVGRLIDPAEALSRLRSARLLRHDAGGYATLRSGLGELLAEQAEQVARDALDELIGRVKDAHVQAMAALTEQALVRMTYRNADIATSVTELLDRLHREPDATAREQLSEQIAENVGQLRTDQYGSALAELKGPSAQCDLADIVRDLSRRVEKQAGVTISFQQETPGTVHAVRAQLEVAVVQLLIRAVQDLRDVPVEKRAVMVRLRGATRGTGDDDRAWGILDVEDSGPGLTAEERTIILGGDVFAENGSGGFGLRSSRQIIREYGGKIEILSRSETLGGTHLRVWLPCA